MRSINEWKCMKVYERIYNHFGKKPIEYTAEAFWYCCVDIQMKMYVCSTVEPDFCGRPVHVHITLCDLNSNKVIRYRRVFVWPFNTTKLHYTEGVYTLWGNGVLYLCNVVIGQCYIPLRVQAKITEYGINDGTCNVLQYL